MKPPVLWWQDAMLSKVEVVKVAVTSSLYNETAGPLEDQPTVW